MGMNQAPASERIHISFFGRRNAGKSSVINAVTGQDLAIVSDVEGTTTDPVYKTMELLPMGPVMLIDTPGIDDEGELGVLRVKKSYQVLNKTDVAILVIDAAKGMASQDELLIERFQRKKIPYLIVYNKMDCAAARQDAGEQELFISARDGTGIQLLKERIARLSVKEDEEKVLVRDLLSPGDFVVLVIPIDKAAPKGRLILPQQQTIRDILKGGAAAIAVGGEELKQTLRDLGRKPVLVITDSQIFPKVSAAVPADISLTSFSILFARYKGDLVEMVQGAKAVDGLKDGDRILIAEGCTHHRQCEDIGTVKLPRWIEEYTGKKLEFIFTSGTEFPENLTEYAMVVHCGGCMLNRREMNYRVQCTRDQKIPITNYGMLIAYLKGILARSVQPFGEAARILYSDDTKK